MVTVDMDISSARRLSIGRIIVIIAPTCCGVLSDKAICAKVSAVNLSPLSAEVC